MGLGKRPFFLCLEPNRTKGRLFYGSHSALSSCVLNQRGDNAVILSFSHFNALVGIKEADCSCEGHLSCNCDWSHEGLHECAVVIHCNQYPSKHDFVHSIRYARVSNFHAMIIVVKGVVTLYCLIYYYYSKSIVKLLHTMLCLSNLTNADQWICTMQLCWNLQRQQYKKH